MILNINTCDFQIGCVPLQQQLHGSRKPIGCRSRSLTDARREHDTTQREFLAIVWAELMLQPYLEGTRFSIRMDHHSVKWILNLTDSTKRLSHCRLQHSEFDFNVVHHEGVKRQAADTLARLQTTGEDDKPLEDDLHLPAIDEQSNHASMLVLKANSDVIIPLNA